MSTGHILNEYTDFCTQQSSFIVLTNSAVWRYQQLSVGIQNIDPECNVT